MDSYKKSRRKSIIAWIIAFVLAIGAAIVSFTPFIFMVLNSFKEKFEMLTKGVFQLPDQLNWSNYTEVLTGGFANYFKNSVIVLAISLILLLFISACASYPLARFKFKMAQPIYAQIFNEDGQLIPVTVLQAGPCVVTQVKTEENDGYEAVQVGFGDIRESLVNKPEKGHFDKAGVAVKRFVKEFRFDNAAEYTVGQEIKADIFADGDHIDATAVSKGKGFQGAIKRHGQSRGPMAHGSKYHRHAGSNGACSDPSKVFKGKHMPGHMGNVQVTVQNLEIVRVDTENNLLLVKGAVPGPKKSLVTIKETVKSL